MRKFLLLLFAAGMLSRADAQFAALCIDNISNPCDVYVTMQFNCPAPILAGGCSNSGGTMTDQYNYVGGAGCFMSAGSWSSGLGCRNAQWTDGCGVGGCYLDNVTLTFW